MAGLGQGWGVGLVPAQHGVALLGGWWCGKARSVLKGVRGWHSGSAGWQAGWLATQHLPGACITAQCVTVVAVLPSCCPSDAAPPAPTCPAPAAAP